MINVYNKSNVYYLLNVVEGTYFLIGDKEELLVFLSRGFDRNTSYYDIKKNYSEYLNRDKLSNVYFDKINMGNDVLRYKNRYIAFNDDGDKFFVYEEEIFQRPYLFFDGNNRTIDVREFRDEAYKVYIERCKSPNSFYSVYWKNRKYHPYPSKVGHGGCSYKNKVSLKYQAKRIDSMLDTCYKDFHFKHLEDSNNPYPDWWDDTCRIIEGNWKSQYKSNRQYGAHTSSKDNRSIRKYEDDEFSYDDIDEMLLEDFENNFKD